MFTLAEAFSGGLGGLSDTTNALDSYPSVDSKSLRGEVRITGNYYQLFLTVDQDLGFSSGAKSVSTTSSAYCNLPSGGNTSR